MNYKHYIFDVDGTLVDNEYAVLHAWQDTIHELQGKAYPIDELTFTMGIPGEAAMSKFGVEDTAAAFRLWDSHFRKYKSNIRLFDGIEQALRRLAAAGVRLGVVTSRTHREFDHDRILAGVADLFDTVICVEDSPRPKPFPDPMLAYLRRAGAQAREVVFIGDTAYDSQCARSAGVDFGLAVWGNAAPGEIEAKYYFDRPEEVLKVH